MTRQLDRIPERRGADGTLFGDSVLVAANAVPIPTGEVRDRSFPDELVTTRMAVRYQMSLRLARRTACSLTSNVPEPRRFAVATEVGNFTAVQRFL